jgi:hypothetical protein
MLYTSYATLKIAAVKRNAAHLSLKCRSEIQNDSLNLKKT